MHTLYFIQNNISNKIYVGITHNFNRRHIQHKSALKRKKHINKYLQSSWIKHGSSNFEFIVGNTQLTEEEAKHIEQLLINYYLVVKRSYNQTLGGDGYTALTKEIKQRAVQKTKETKRVRYPNGLPSPMKGRKHSLEARLKIKLKRTNQVFSSETKAKISKRLLGNKYCLGRIDSEETKNKRYSKIIGKFRNGKMYEAFGEHKTLTQWARDNRCIVCRTTLKTRITIGWSMERSLISSLHKNKL